MANKKPKGAPRKRPSGPSGQHTKPGIMLRATPEEFAAWRATAGLLSHPNLTSWIRAVCNIAARRAGQK